MDEAVRRSLGAAAGRGVGPGPTTRLLRTMSEGRRPAVLAHPDGLPPRLAGGSPGLNPTDPAQPTSCVGRHGRLTAADAMRPWRAGLPSGRSLGAASELGGSSLDLVLVGDREPAGARSDAGRARNAISDDQPTAVRTIASALQLGHGLRALWRRLDLPIAGARRVLRHGGDRRLGHPTATSSAMRNSVLVVRARGPCSWPPSSGTVPADPASEF
jgi:hypothetical protein